MDLLEFNLLTISYWRDGTKDWHAGVCSFTGRKTIRSLFLIGRCKGLCLGLLWFNIK